jgi:hypothetical protein
MLTRRIERLIPAVLALVVVSGGIVAGYRTGFSELKLLHGWIGLATVALCCSVVLTFVGMLAFVRKNRCVPDSRGNAGQHATASSQKLKVTKRRLDTAVRNMGALDAEERSLLMDALKRYPYCIEVAEFGPSQVLISKEFLCVFGDVGGQTLICKVHPWLAAHRNELIGIYGGGSAGSLAIR